MTAARQLHSLALPPNASLHFFSLEEERLVVQAKHELKISAHDLTVHYRGGYAWWKFGVYVATAPVSLDIFGHKGLVLRNLQQQSSLVPSL